MRFHPLNSALIVATEVEREKEPGFPEASGNMWSHWRSAQAVVICPETMLDELPGSPAENRHNLVGKMSRVYGKCLTLEPSELVAE